MFFNVTIMFQDSRRRNTRRSIGFDGNFDDAVVFAGALASAYADVSDARVTGWSVTASNTVTDAEGAVSNIDAGATIRVALLSDPPRYGTINIPSPEASIVGDVGQVLLTETDLAALEDLLQSGGARVAYEPVGGFVSGWLDK